MRRSPRQARDEGIELRATTVTRFEHQGGRIAVSLGDGTAISASLLVAADGARSGVREQAGIATHGWSVRTIRDRHHGCA